MLQPLWDNHQSLFRHNQANIHLLERNADQMACYAHYVHLCFHARISKES